MPNSISFIRNSLLVPELKLGAVEQNRRKSGIAALGGT